MSSQLLVDLRLRSDGPIEVIVQRAGKPERACSSAANPAAALSLAREQIGLTETGSVSVVLSREDELLGSWSTSSASLALYWAADALEKAWRPARSGLASEQISRVSVAKSDEREGAA